ncbi:MAG: hypothetical protein IJ431_05225 [Alistipes sp.]|nr:hypothetical protein [Alistipes sp.]MBQ8553583.1 hypothetical protein [Alistipes sp.]
MNNIIPNKYGEPYSGDSKFVAKCRALQSVYRVAIGEAIRPYIGKDRAYYFGNYIEHGETTGANFLEDYIFVYAKYRVAYKKPFETINSDRLFNNLLSSQPMAFNLFCPLRKMLCESPETATRVIQSALPNYSIARVTDVDLEFIPENYTQLTGDRSAMDAIIRFVDKDGRDSFVAIETKYSENLGANEASESNRERSKELVKQLGCFSQDAETLISKSQIKLTQIYRNFLLSEVYGRHTSTKSYSLIMAPAGHPSTSRELESIVDKLRSEHKYKLQHIPLEEFVRKLITHSPAEYKTVFEKFFNRYLEFFKLESL